MIIYRTFLFLLYTQIRTASANQNHMLRAVLCTKMLHSVRWKNIVLQHDSQSHYNLINCVFYKSFINK